MKISIKVDYNVTSDARASKHNVHDVSRLILRYEPKYVLIHQFENLLIFKIQRNLFIDSDWIRAVGFVFWFVSVVRQPSAQFCELEESQVVELCFLLI
jgi:hypothetical protein